MGNHKKQWIFFQNNLKNKNKKVTCCSKNDFIEIQIIQLEKRKTTFLERSQHPFWEKTRVAFLFPRVNMKTLMEEIFNQEKLVNIMSRI
jgi:hypothetical protein